MFILILTLLPCQMPDMDITTPAAHTASFQLVAQHSAIGGAR
jgi:hypothetical protein